MISNFQHSQRSAAKSNYSWISKTTAEIYKYKITNKWKQYIQLIQKQNIQKQNIQIIQKQNIEYKKAIFYTVLLYLTQ